MLGWAGAGGGAGAGDGDEVGRGQEFSDFLKLGEFCDWKLITWFWAGLGLKLTV